MIRIGQGIDFHQFSNYPQHPQYRDFKLGGILIPSPFGVLAHSDGDVVLHSLMDSLLGALGKDDIGVLFPNSDPKWENISSVDLCKIVLEKINLSLWNISNVDITIVLENPKLSLYKNQIKASLSQLLNLPPELIAIKATTTETMGFIGRSEGIMALTTLLLQISNEGKK